MKIYRTLGTILSSFLIVILVIALFSSMLVFSAARAVSKNTISDITKAIVANEDVRAEISTSLSSSIADVLQSALGNSSDQTGNVENPSGGNPGTSEGNVGSPEGNIGGSEGNVGESEGNVIDPEQNENSTPSTPENDLLAFSEGLINNVLNMPAVQDTIGDIVAEYAMAILEQKNPEVSLSESIENMFAENPEAFNTQIENVVTQCQLTYDDIYEIAASIAEESESEVPAYGASYTDLILSVFGQVREEIDALLDGILTEFLPATDSAEAIPTVKNARAFTVLTAMPLTSIPANNDTAEAESALAIFSNILSILQDPKIYFAVFALLLIFFLITALFTWSFRRPLLFIGIAMIITSLLLLAVTFFPIPYDALAEMAADMIMPDSATMVSTVRDVIVATWYNAASVIGIHAIACLLIGALCCTGFALLRIHAKKKATEAEEVTVEETVPEETAVAETIAEETATETPASAEIATAE